MKPMSEAHFAILRRHMVEVIGIQVDLASEELGKAALDERVLAAMRKVPRHRFVPSFLAPLAYQDTPLPIGFDKTISQPFIVALMTDLLGPEPHDSILEVGTGLGYQAAVLAELSGRVWSVEIVEELAGQAEANLRQLGCSDVAIRIGDGSRGWREHAPYDRALLTAAAELALMRPLIVTGTETTCACVCTLLGSRSRISGSFPTASITLFSGRPSSLFISSGRVVQPSADAGGWIST